MGSIEPRLTEEASGLRKRVAQLEKINSALMGRVERAMDLQGDAFSLFQAASVLEKRVAERTAALDSALADLRCSNQDLTVAKNKAEAAARAKDEFLAGMSHELRTPLNAVLGLSEALQDEVYGALNDKQRQCLGAIEASGRHLLSLISDILDIARVGAGELRLDLGSVRLDEVCAKSLEMVRRQADTKHLRLTSNIAGDLRLLTTDSKRLTQILVNLLGNAVKFTPDGGAVALQVRLAADGEAIELSVTDSGIGISADDLERVFQPFVQVDSRLARLYEGTGLGLALVQRLTSALGGSVALTSELGIGSCFTVRFPYQPTATAELAEVSPSVRAEHSEPTSGPRLVLLAEDNEANRMTIGDYLVAKGYRVAYAENGAQAVERVRQLRPDLVLMDIQMPEMDGLEAMAAIRADAEFGALPIVALTAMAMSGDRQRCLDAGATDYLSKPVRLKGLVQVIEQQLRSPSARAPAVLEQGS